MKKIFGELNLTWKKVIILAILMGTYTAIMAMLPVASETSFSDIAVTFEVWILFGIIIIMNSKSAKDSALKCFVFFLISQPLVYLIQDIINGSQLFITYYRYWFIWTVGTIPMGFIGYYMKKDKWWSVLILTPILVLLGFHLSEYLSQTIFSFPRHLLTTIFCAITLIIYPLYIFKNYKNKIFGLSISIIIIILSIVLSTLKPIVYSTDILSNSEEHKFDSSYKVYLTDESFGNISIRYEEGIDDYFVHAEFKKSGTTSFILESPNKSKRVFYITIKSDTFTISEKK